MDPIGRYFRLTVIVHTLAETDLYTRHTTECCVLRRVFGVCRSHKKRHFWQAQACPAFAHAFAT